MYVKIYIHVKGCFEFKHLFLKEISMAATNNLQIFIFFKANMVPIGPPNPKNAPPLKVPWGFSPLQIWNQLSCVAVVPHSHVIQSQISVKEKSTTCHSGRWTGGSQWNTYVLITASLVHLYFLWLSESLYLRKDIELEKEYASASVISVEMLYCMWQYSSMLSCFFSLLGGC